MNFEIRVDLRMDRIRPAVKLRKLNEMELACKEFYAMKDKLLVTAPQSMEDMRNLLRPV